MKRKDHTSVASWSAPLLAFIPPNVAGLGVNGFGHFSRKKSRSSAGAKPGNTKNHLDIMVVNTQDELPITTVGIDRLGENVFWQTCC
jgi:hypothetical protein